MAAQQHRTSKFIPIEELLRKQQPSHLAVTKKGPFRASTNEARNHVLISDEDDEAEEEEEEEEEEEQVDEDLRLPEELLSRMFDHQKAGVAWMNRLHKRYRGGILGDDMGMGKTFQICCFLTGQMRAEAVSKVLIICPVSVLASWQRELHEHLAPHVRRVGIEVSSSELAKRRRVKILEDAWASRYPRIVISSYMLVSNMVDEFAGMGKWDYVILDEGHIVKNPSTKTSKAMHALPSRHRMVLTGTPIQNHLTEFHALLDWCTFGSLGLGTRKDFVERFEEPINKAQDPRASTIAQNQGREAAQELLRLTKPIILQRKKSDVGSIMLKLPTKKELAVWIPISTQQRGIYEKFISTREVANVIAGARSSYPLEMVNHLKTLCRHPFLIEASQMAKKRATQLKEAKQRKMTGYNHGDDDEEHNGHEEDEDDLLGGLEKSLRDMSIAKDKGRGEGGEERDEEDRYLSSLSANASVFDVAGRTPSTRELLQGSVKLRVLLKLTTMLVEGGHRVLIFSQSRMMLDILQSVLANYGLGSARIDGSVVGKERQRVIDSFNSKDNPMSENILVLSTKACGTGITLTGADRVILHDPSWNPAEDRQAVDRAFRIGQDKPVVVYRLLNVGCVEEIMYEKQVFKDGVRAVMESQEGSSSSKYFSREEITSLLFELSPPGVCKVQEKIKIKLCQPSDGGGEAAEAMGGGGGGGEGGREEEEEVEVGAELQIRGVYGFSRHDELYEEKAVPKAPSSRPPQYNREIEEEMTMTSSTGKKPISRPNKAPIAQRQGSLFDFFEDTSRAGTDGIKAKPTVVYDLNDSPPPAAAGGGGKKPDNGDKSDAAARKDEEESSEEEAEWEEAVVNAPKPSTEPFAAHEEEEEEKGEEQEEDDGREGGEEECEHESEEEAEWEEEVVAKAPPPPPLPFLAAQPSAAHEQNEEDEEEQEEDEEEEDGAPQVSPQEEEQQERQSISSGASSPSFATANSHPSLEASPSEEDNSHPPPSPLAQQQQPLEEKLYGGGGGEASAQEDEQEEDVQAAPSSVSVLTPAFFIDLVDSDDDDEEDEEEGEGEEEEAEDVATTTKSSASSSAAIAVVAEEEILEAVNVRSADVSFAQDEEEGNERGEDDEEEEGELLDDGSSPFSPPPRLSFLHRDDADEEEQEKHAVNLMLNGDEEDDDDEYDEEEDSEGSLRDFIVNSDEEEDDEDDEEDDDEDGDDGDDDEEEEVEEEEEDVAKKIHSSLRRKVILDESSEQEQEQRREEQEEEEEEEEAEWQEDEVDLSRKLSAMKDDSTAATPPGKQKQQQHLQQQQQQQQQQREVSYSHWRKATIRELPLLAEERASCFSSQNRPSALPLLRPLLSLTSEQVQQYNELVAQGSKKKQLTREERTACLVAALELCDEDVNLHGLLAYSFAKLRAD